MIAFYHSPIGILLLEEQNDAITRIVQTNSAGKSASSALLDRCIASLDRYFRAEEEHFDLPIAPDGTEFRKKVWKELRRIPYGKTASYKEIAERCCGSARYARAVASAAHHNPILIAIPCHRMIAADGSLGGFALGTEAKHLLLKTEQLENHQK